MGDPTNAGIEAAAEAVSAMPPGQQAWGTKEFEIARVAAMAATQQIIQDICSLLSQPFLSVYLVERSPNGADILTMPGDRIGDTTEIIADLQDNPAEEAARIFDDACRLGYREGHCVVTIWHQAIMPPDGPGRYWEYDKIDEPLTNMFWGTPSEQDEQIRKMNDA